MHHWIVASVATDLRKHRSVEVLNDRRQYYYTEKNLEKLRSRRRKEAILQHNKLHGKHSCGDISGDLQRYVGSRRKKTPDTLLPPVQITVAKSWDNVMCCGKTREDRRVSSGRLLSPSDLPLISRSKSQGDVAESIKAFQSRTSRLSPTLLSPSSPVRYGSFSNSHYLSTSVSGSDLTRSISDNDVRSDQVKLIKPRKRSGSWNCLKSPNTSSSENSPDRETINCSVFNSMKSSHSEDFGKRAGEKGIRAWLGLASKRTVSPQRKGHR